MEWDKTGNHWYLPGYSLWIDLLILKTCFVIDIKSVTMIRMFISDKFREFEQMEVNVRGTLSQIHNDALPAPARQKVTSMLNSLSK